MLLHLSPRLFLNPRFPEPACTLINYVCEELDLHLTGDEDLMVKRPYPNKSYLIACRKGRKAVSGILVDVARKIDEFKAVARWSVDGEHIVSHTVHFKIMDDEFDMCSCSMMLWSAFHDGKKLWPKRRPAWTEGRTIASSQPRMVLIPNLAEWTGEDESEPQTTSGIISETFHDGIIVERTEVFQMPTIEKERLLNEESRQFFRSIPFPSLDHVFQ